MGDKGYKPFFLKLLLGAAILLVADRVAGLLIRNLYFKQAAGDICRATYTIDSSREQILVLGSSRASHHYVPGVLTNLLGKSCYNAGRDGSEILNNYAIFKMALKRYSPELIIIELAPKELYYTQEDYDKLSTLLPYYDQHPEIRDIVNLRGKFEKYKLYSSIYPFNSQLISLAIGKLRLTKDPGLSTSGYLPLYQKMKNVKADNFLKDPGELIDSNKRKALNDILTTCRQKKIPIIFICSPVLNNAVNKNVTIEINRIVNKYQTAYWDFSNDSTFDNHPEYFKDNSHMNDRGAKLFSTIIAERIASKKSITQGQQ